VLFDRYSDDLLVDPRRYRYGGPKWAARLWRRLIPRPDLFLVLDIPKERLRERKVEVAPQELDRQVRAYREFVANTPNAILLDGSGPIEEVVAQARDALLEHLHLRYLQRRGIWFPAETSDGLSWLADALGAALRPGRSTHVFLRLPDGRGYLLPAESARAFRSGLDLYPAQAAKARAAKGALRSLSYLGLKAPGIARMHLGDPDTGCGVLQTLREVFARKDLVFAVSLGTPGPHRKPVLKVMTASGEVLGFAKVGWDEVTRALVQNEARVLQMLRDWELPFGVPRVLYAGDNGAHTLCVQTPLLGRVLPAPRELTTEYVETLCALARKGLARRPLDESRFWKRIIERGQRIENAYWRRVLHRALEAIHEDWRDREVPFHFAHGDFAPWNVLWADRRLFLLDWEYAQEEAPAGYDLFHFLVQTARLLENRDTRHILTIVLERSYGSNLRRYWDEVITRENEIAALLQLYLVDRLVHPSNEYLPHCWGRIGRILQTALGERS
jgi:hypothetical protein